METGRLLLLSFGACAAVAALKALIVTRPEDLTRSLEFSSILLGAFGAFYSFLHFALRSCFHT